MPKKCAVVGCPSMVGHRFPQNPELRRKWLEALGLDSFCQPYDRLVVCYKHFVPTDYAPNIESKSRKRLRFNAYPTASLKLEPKVSSPPTPAQNELQEAKTNKTYSIITKRPTYGVYSKKTVTAQVEEISVIGEPTYNEQNSGPVDSVTDEVLEIPVEEMIIKEEPEESCSYAEDPLSLQTVDDEPSAMPIVNDEKKAKRHQGLSAVLPHIPPKLIFFNNPALNKHLQIKKQPVQAAGSTTIMTTIPKVVRLQSSSPRGRPFVIQNTFSLAAPKTDLSPTVKGKNHIDDFLESDMEDQPCAYRFYNLAMQLKESLRAKIRMLEDEIAALKKNASYCHLYHKGLPKQPEGQVFVDPFAADKKPDAVPCSPPPRKLICKPAPPHPTTAYRSNVLDRGTSTITPRQLEVLPLPEECGLNTKNIFAFSGAYRIVELEYFSNAICNMHHRHHVECPNGKMVVDSETLSGIAGKWTFKCVECGHKRVILTDPSSCTQVASNWLTWMVIQPLSRLLHAQMIFSNLGVPFIFKISPSTLKVLTFKRQISNVDGVPVSVQSSRKSVRRTILDNGSASSA